MLSNYFICMHFLWGRKSRANRERFVIGVVLRSRRIGSWDVNLSSKVSTPFKVELDLLIVYIPFIYSQRAKSQNSCLPFCQCFQVMNAIEENSIAKSIKDVSKFGGTLFERNICSFCWLNSRNLLKLLAYLDTSNQQSCKKISAMLSLFTEFTTEFESTLVIIRA